MSIQKQITVRYREEGHVRFQIPKQLCDKGVAKQITAHVLAIEGVYKVDLFHRNNKLSIRYHETACNFKQLAEQFFELLSDLDNRGLLTAKVEVEIEPKKPSRWNIKTKVKNLKASQWVGEKYTDAKETVQAAKVVTKLGMKKPKLFMKNPETAIIGFFNDILVLYLIKLHWTRITKEWIPNPWLFRTQWTAVFYLFYLLMRSRRSK